MKHLSIDQLVEIISTLTEELKTLVKETDIRRGRYFRQQLSLELASRY